MMMTDHFLKYVLLCSLLICATRGNVIGNGATGGGDATCCLDGLVEKKLCLTLYMHQNMNGPNQNQVVVKNSTLAGGFGLTAVNDWEIYDGRDQNAKLVARAQGLHFQSGWFKEQWYSSQNIVFEDDSGWNGSSLEVRGPWKVPSPIRWAIVGGTGDFTFAQGIVSGKILSANANTRIIEISIQALYRPMENAILADI